MLKLIYCSAYLKYDFGPGHPFGPKRALQFLKKLEKFQVSNARFAGFLRNSKLQIVKPQPAKDRDILLVHTKDYLDRVKKLAQENGFLSADTPVNPNILKAAYYSVGGSILACDLALEGNLGINLLGGLHHAGISHSSGFCIFNDHSIAIRKLQQEKKIKKAMILDLDVHAGQGTQEIFYADPTVFTISLHQDPTTLYPGTGFAWQKGEGKGEGFNLNIPLSPGTGEAEYLTALKKVLPLYNEFKPDLLVVVFGADTYKNDPLGNINLEIRTYWKIGQKLADKKPLAAMFAGGYSRDVPKIWLSFLEGLTSKNG
jgi:acetoin utilization protein AcuC